MVFLAEPFARVAYIRIISFHHPIPNAQANARFLFPSGRAGLRYLLAGPETNR